MIIIRVSLFIANLCYYYITILTILQELDTDYYSDDDRENNHGGKQHQKPSHLELPYEVDELIHVVATKGTLPYDWATVRKALILKIRLLLQQSYGRYGFIDIEGEHGEGVAAAPREYSSSSSKPLNHDQFIRRREYILSLLRSYEDAPFTIQRIAELALNGSVWYTGKRGMCSCLYYTSSFSRSLA